MSAQRVSTIRFFKRRTLEAKDTSRPSHIMAETRTAETIVTSNDTDLYNSSPTKHVSTKLPDMIDRERLIVNAAKIKGATSSPR